MGMANGLLLITCIPLSSLQVRRHTPGTSCAIFLVRELRSSTALEEKDNTIAGRAGCPVLWVGGARRFAHPGGSFQQGLL